jgi:fluoroquinolone resistance protein
MNTIADTRFSNEDINLFSKEAVNYEMCIFDTCNFQSADFSYCNFTNCTFTNSNLSVMTIKNCNISETKFISCKITGVDWTVVSNSLLFDNIFDDCVLDMSNFSLLNLSHILITDSSLKDCVFTDTNLSKSILKNCDFQKTLFHNSNLTLADFRGSKNYFIDIRSNNVKKARFSLPEATNLLLPFDLVIDW